MKRGVCREGDFLQIRILSEKLCLASISALFQVKRKCKKKKNSPNHNANKYLWYRLKFLLTVYQGQKELGLPRVIYEHREISV